MPRDANGVYTLPPSYHVQTGDTVLPVQHNPPFEDVANALTNSIDRDGRTVMTGPLQMGGNKVTNVAPGTNDVDAINVLQLRDRVDAVADFATVSDLLADNNQRIGYAGSGARVIVTEGQIITAQGFRYEVAASGATDVDLETVGGVKLKNLNKILVKLSDSGAGRSFSVTGHFPFVYGGWFVAEMPSSPSGPSTLLVDGDELDILTPSRSQIPNDFWSTGEKVPMIFDGDKVIAHPSSKISRKGFLTAIYDPSGLYRVSGRLKAIRSSNFELGVTEFLPLPLPSDIPTYSASFNNNSGDFAPGITQVTTRAFADFDDRVSVSLFRMEGAVNFLADDFCYIDTNGDSEWYPFVESRITSEGGVFGYYNPDFSSWVTPAPSGTNNGSVLQGHFVDYPNGEIIILQTSGGTAYFRRLNLSTGLPVASNYEVAVSGNHIHQSFHWDGVHYWAGGEVNTTTVPTVQRVLRAGGSRTAFQFDPTKSGLPGSQSDWNSNVTLSVDESNDVVAIRVRENSPRNAILLGSWASFKSDSEAWVADHVFFPSPPQDEDVFQAISVKDGAVFLLTGYFERTGKKWLIAYDFDGKVLDRRNLTLGRDSTAKHEPEGLHIYSDGVDEWLTINFETGGPVHNHKMFRARKKL